MTLHGADDVFLAFAMIKKWNEIKKTHDPLPGAVGVPAIAALLSPCGFDVLVALLEGYCRRQQVLSIER